MSLRVGGNIGAVSGEAIQTEKAGERFALPSGLLRSAICRSLAMTKGLPTMTERLSLRVAKRRSNPSGEGIHTMTPRSI
ncbi:MAG: hypothetical protein LBT00_05720 [Spirochaetaceae bacterium]|nr:hypothetical protein [Spirochaetaceae bacterium]